MQCSHRRMCHVPFFSPSHHHRAIWWVLSKNSNKHYGTKYCKWISVRASALSPFINEQVFVSRQCTQIDSIRLLDKWLLHLLQRARRKHIRSGKHTSEWKDRSLCCSSTAATSQYTTTAHRRSSSTAAPLVTSSPLVTQGGESERLRIIGVWWGAIVIRDSVLLGFLHMAPKVYTDKITVINKISLINSGKASSCFY